MDFTFATQLHYLIHHVDGDFVAHCLDLDLVGVGDTQQDAVAALKHIGSRARVFYDKD